MFRDMRSQLDAIDPRARFSPNQLAAIERELARTDRAPIGAKVIRRAMRSGELRSFANGRGRQALWGDYLAWREGNPAPVVSDAVERDVIAQLRREEATHPGAAT